MGISLDVLEAQRKLSVPCLPVASYVYAHRQQRKLRCIKRRISADVVLAFGMFMLLMTVGSKWLLGL